MWTLVTNVPKKEQAIVVLLEENQKAEKAVSDLTATQLNVDDGLEVLLDKLDTAFQAEATDDTYSAYTEFNNYKKGHNTSMNDYILELEHLNHKILEYDMKLPVTVLAFKSLDGAGLCEQQRQMTLNVASDLKFETMRSALKKIFSNETSADSTVEMQIKKEEDAFVSVRRRDSFKYGQKQRESQYQGSSSFKGSSKLSSAPKLNPMNRKGEVSRCAICD